MGRFCEAMSAIGESEDIFPEIDNVTVLVINHSEFYTGDFKKILNIHVKKRKSN
jgi:hypothetical protein